VNEQEHAPYEVVFEPMTSEGVILGNADPAYREIMCGCTEELRFRWADHLALADREGLDEWEDILR